MYDSLCRVCLRETNVETMVPITEKLGNRCRLSYSKVILRFAKTYTDFNNLLPAKLCLDCKKSIENMYFFTRMCRKNDRKLNELVKLAEGKSDKLKGLVCDYSLKVQYFPAYSKLEAKKYSLETQECDDFHVNYIKSDHSVSLSNTYSNQQNIDSILESIEEVIEDDKKPKLSYSRTVDKKEILNSVQHSPKNIDYNGPKWKYAEKLSVDEMLDSVEQALNNKIRYHSIKTKLRGRPLKLNRYSIGCSKMKSEVKNYKAKRNLKCKICSKILANEATFKYHMQMHTNYKYICDQCGKGYPGKDSLNNHLVTKHDKGTFVQCEQCSFKCPKRHELIEHMRLHTGERPFACEKCGLTFRRRAVWKIHLKHHQEKKIVCKLCEKKFVSLGQLHAHQNTSHERKYLYMCHICNVTYVKNGAVRKHLTAKHAIPREKQGKILRVSKETNSSLFIDNK